MSQTKTALITGATSGIGYQLAKLFAQDGYRLILVARNQEKLEQIAREFKYEHKVFVKVISIDLAKAKAAKKVFEAVTNAKMEVDVLVNNAGVGGYGLFSEREYTDEIQMINLNVRAVVALTHLFLPQMLERKSGKILQVASTAGFLSGPYMANYYATKNYVLSFSEALAEELSGTGVSVTIVCPGPTDTEFARSAGADHSPIFKGSILKPEQVAQEAYQALNQQKRLIIVGGSKWLIRLSRLLPREFVTKMIGRFQRSKKKET